MSETSSSDFQYPVLSICEDFVVIDKPEGHHVHPPEDESRRRFVNPENVVLSNLRRQLGLYLYPVHRLDVATSGVLVFALSKETARAYARLQELGRIEKTYHLVCRGWTEDEFDVDLPLELDSTKAPVASLTKFRSLARFEVDALPGGKYPRSRYALLEARPVTGRWHQIRRHLNRVSRPIIGDNDHGDSRHNRYFRESFGLGGLCLRAVGTRLCFENGRVEEFRAMATPKWERIYDFVRAHEIAAPDLSSGGVCRARADVPGLPANGRED